MKILHVSHLYFPSIGGNQYHNQVMSEKLADQGEEVHVFTAHAITMDHFESYNPVLKKLSFEEVVNGVHVHRFKINYWFRDLVFQKKMKVRGAYRLFKKITGDAYDLWRQGPVMWSMLWGIFRLKPDVIVATNYYFFTTYLCYLARKLFKIPLIIMPVTHMADPWVGHPMIKRLYDRADLLIACTDFEKKHIASLGYKDKVVSLPLGIKPDIFKGAEGKNIKEKYHLGDGPIIAYVGRKVPGKGIETLIDAMRFVWPRYPSAQLVLAGHVEEYFVATIQKHVKQYSSEEQKKIISIDNFSNSEKGDFYQVVDIVAMPSNTDCFGMVYLEAWASGKPVIACKNTPQETIIRDGIDGLLVPYYHKQELADALYKLLIDEDLRLKMGNNGKEIVRTKYNIDIYGSNLKKTYAALLAQLKIKHIKITPSVTPLTKDDLQQKETLIPIEKTLS